MGADRIAAAAPSSTCHLDRSRTRNVEDLLFSTLRYRRCCAYARAPLRISCAFTAIRCSRLNPVSAASSAPASRPSSCRYPASPAAASLPPEASCGRSSLRSLRLQFGNLLLGLFQLPLQFRSRLGARIHRATILATSPVRQPAAPPAMQPSSPAVGRSLQTLRGFYAIPLALFSSIVSSLSPLRFLLRAFTGSAQALARCKSLPCFRVLCFRCAQAERRPCRTQPFRAAESPLP